MHRRLACVLLLLGLLTFGLVSPGQSAHASPLADPLDCGSASLYQETIPGGVLEGDWSTVDDSLDGPLGTLRDDLGNPPGGIDIVGGGSTRDFLEVMFPTEVTIYSVSFEVRGTGSGSIYLQLWSGETEGTGDFLYNYSVGDSGAPHDWAATSFNEDDFGTDGQSGVRSVLLGRTSSDAAGLDNIYICYSDGTSPGLTRPLTSADEDPAFTTFDNNGDTSHVDDYFRALGDQEGLDPELTGFRNIVTAVSRHPYADVYAAEDGTVAADGLQRLNNCGDYCVAFAPAEPGDTLYDTWKLHDDNDLWLVKIDVADGQQLQYIVRDADQYVRQGMTISAGCIVGKTVPIEPIGESPSASLASKELTMVSLVDTGSVEINELLSQLTEVPDQGLACNADPATADCLGNNPRFLNGGDKWLTTGSVTFGAVNGGGAVLQPGAEIYQNVTLDPETEYALNANAKSTEAGTGVKLYIGSTYVAYLVSPPNYKSLVLDPAVPAGSIGFNGTLFEIGLVNLGDGVVTITHLCITTDAPPATHGVCYFQDPSFDEGTSYWDTDGSAVPGALILNDGQTAAQSVILPAGDYRVRAKMRINYTGSTPPEAGDVKLLYEYPVDNGFNEVGTVSVSDPLLTFLDFDTTFTLADPTDDVITFKAEIQGGADEAVLGLVIDQLCLEPADGGGFPPGGGGDPPPFNADCVVVIRPSVDAPVQLWIDYLWNQLNKFFTCQLMVVLNNIWGTIRYFFTTVGWAIRSSFAYGAIYNHWLQVQFFPYLSGHFANIASGRTTTITESGDGSCHDLFCVLDSLITGALNPLVGAVTRIVDFILWLLTQAAGTLLTLVVALFGLFFTIITTILHFFQLMIGYLQSIVLGFNLATPTPLPGIPQCQLDPQGNAVCIGLWMLENTVFADEGQLYIPLLIGAMSIALIFWAVDNFRKKLGDIGDKL